MVTNTQFSLVVGIPSLLIVLKWIDTNRRISEIIRSLKQQQKQITSWN